MLFGRESGAAANIDVATAETARPVAPVAVVVRPEPTEKNAPPQPSKEEVAAPKAEAGDATARPAPPAGADDLLAAVTAAMAAHEADRASADAEAELIRLVMPVLDRQRSNNLVQVVEEALRARAAGLAPAADTDVVSRRNAAKARGADLVMPHALPETEARSDRERSSLAAPPDAPADFEPVNVEALSEFAVPSVDVSAIVPKPEPEADENEQIPVVPLIDSPLARIDMDAEKTAGLEAASIACVEPPLEEQAESAGAESSTAAQDEVSATSSPVAPPDEAVVPQVEAATSSSAAVDPPQAEPVQPAAITADSVPAITDASITPATPSQPEVVQSMSPLQVVSVAPAPVHSAASGDPALGAALAMAIGIEGGLCAAITEIASGQNLEAVGNGADPVVAGENLAAMLRTKLKVIGMLRLKDSLEDVIVTLGTQIHMLRMIDEKTFLLVVLDRKSANLALARYRASEAVDRLRGIAG